MQRHAEMPPELQAKLARLSASIMTHLKSPPPLELDGAQLPAPILELTHFTIQDGSSLQVYYRIPPLDASLNQSVSREQLTDATRRLLTNIRATLDQLAWNDIRIRLGAQPVTRTAKKKVLVSYRKSGPERVTFAQAIADRLGREGFLPWFDEWEIRAGDSLPREISAGFQDVYAVTPVLTGDYPGGTWAREELETAITKRVQQGIRVIPILYEKCDIPELLKPLVYVDCTKHDPDVFETQFAKIIDALNEIELNPYR
jgi:hypothetical protein